MQKANRLFSLCLMILFCNLVVHAQNKKVSGIVSDVHNDPLIGVSVVVSGTHNGVTTDIDGKFSLTVNDEAKSLDVTYLGMKPKVVQITGSTLNITLEEDISVLDEVVVVGYGTVARRDLTGPVSSVGAKQLKDTPVSSASEALQGKMAGVTITTTEGSPDADVKIRVRGGGSLSQDNSPLYIVDGFQVDNIANISPTDIESVDVLKDGSSTAIYGSRGANGVIIVTTKSGKEGKIEVNAGVQFGIRKVAKQVKTLSPHEYVLWQYELDQTGTYGVYDDLGIYRSMKGRDYQDEIFGRTGNQLQYTANVSGGTKDTKFSVSYSRDDENSIMKNSGFTRDNINAKINTKVNQWISLDFNARLSYQKVKGLSGGADSNESSAANSLIARSVIYKPVTELKQDADEDEQNRDTQYDPTERLDATYKQRTRFQQTYNAGITWQPIKDLTFKSTLSYNWDFNDTDQVWATPATSNSKYGFSGMPQALISKDKTKYWQNANTVNYSNKKLFGGEHSINVLLGHEVSSRYTNSIINTSVAFPREMSIDEVLAGMGNGKALPTQTLLNAKDNMVSFFSRVNYSIKEKYLFTATMRADGSSKFASGNQWGYFPSLAFAWRLIDEPWMADAKKIFSDLKPRLGLGTSGNNRINLSAIKPNYQLGGTSDKSIYFDEEAAIILKRGNVLYNPDLKWETTITRNLGIDFGFFNHRLSGSIDAYWNTTKDLLMRSTISAGSGYDSQWKNYGQTSNKGVELSLNAVIVDNKDFSLSANFNISYNRGKIDKLGSGRSWQSSSWAGSGIAGLNDFLIEEGGRLGEVYGYETDGYYTAEHFNWTGNAWELKPEYADSRGKSGMTYSVFGPGALRLKTDENGEVKKVRLGNTVAPVSGGFGLNGTVKGFDFNAFFTYFLGGKIVNATKLGSSYYLGSRKNWNLNDEMSIGNRYTWIDPSNGERIIDRTYINKHGIDHAVNRLNELNAGASSFNPASVTNMPLLDWAVEDGSFLRLSNLTIGYSLPKKLANRMFISNIRIYATGYNLFCLTNYTGADPEVDTRRQTPMTPGVDYSAYPKSRTFVGGVNLTF